MVMKITNRWTGETILEIDGADLARADLADANLRGADLTDADLTDADLRGANLADANLRGANLARADLTGASLTDADLARADLAGASLTGADLTGADLTRASLDFAAWPLFCGSVGVKADDRLACQLAYHAYQLDVSGCSEEVRTAMEGIRPLAQRFKTEFRQDAPELRAGDKENA